MNDKGKLGAISDIVYVRFGTNHEYTNMDYCKVMREIQHILESRDDQFPVCKTCNAEIEWLAGDPYPLTDRTCNDCSISKKN